MRVWSVIDSLPPATCPQMRVPAARSRVLAVKLMLLDVGRVAEALELDARLTAAAAGPLPGTTSQGQRAAPPPAADLPVGADETLEAGIARQAALLRELELDCIAAAGPDVGCGLAGPGRYSAHVRACRDDAVKAFLANIPRACGNCGAAAIKVRVGN